jgi:putative oxidoreductase
VDAVNIGLLLLRVVVGSLFTGHGTQKLLGWFGGHGPDGTGGFFHSIGYRPGKPMAVLGGVAEAGGGLLLLLGLLTPVGSLAIVAMMASATFAVHLSKGLWNTNGGYELPLTFATVATAVAFTGPGRYSVDRIAGWHLSGMAYGIGVAGLGILAALAMNVWRMASLREDSAAHAAGTRDPRAA